jgi:hypothetical protein
VSAWQRLDPIDDDTPANVLAGAILGTLICIIGLAVAIVGLIH